jgi:hypothetical protein
MRNPSSMARDVIHGAAVMDAKTGVIYGKDVIYDASGPVFINR